MCELDIEKSPSPSPFYPDSKPAAAPAPLAASAAAPLAPLAAAPLAAPALAAPALAAAAAKNVNVNVSVINDLKLLIELVVSRGSFKASELSYVGRVYDVLNSIK